MNTTLIPLVFLVFLIMMIIYTTCLPKKKRTPTPKPIMFDLFFGFYISLTTVGIQKTFEIYEQKPDNLKSSTSTLVIVLLALLFGWIATFYQKEKITPNQISSAEELKILANLLERGHLTQSEFDYQKKEIFKKTSIK